MRLKQDGFVREISDLQETVEWKDKKIGVCPVNSNLFVLLVHVQFDSIWWMQTEIPTHTCVVFTCVVVLKYTYLLRQRS